MKTADKTRTTRRTHAHTVAAPAAPKTPDPTRSLYLQLVEPLRKKLTAITEPELLVINADLSEVAAVVLGTIPVLRELRSRVRAELPLFPLGVYDSLEELARAALVLHAAYRVTVEAKDNLPALLTEGDALRTGLVRECVPIAARGEISAEQFAELTLGSGYSATGTDLLGLTHMIRGAWKTIAGRSGITLAQLDRADEIGPQLVAGQEQREHREELLEVRGTERQRMFTLLVRSYQQVRGAVTYLRWAEGDADVLVPSPFARRGAGRPKKQESDPKATEAKKPEETKKAADTSAKGSANAKGAKGGPPLGEDGEPLVPQDNPLVGD